MRLLLILIICLTGLTGCKKYLDKKSVSSQRTPTTLTDLQALLDDDYIMNASINAFGEASADDYYITDDVFNSLAEVNKRYYTWTNFVYNYPNDWSLGYRPVYNANLVLQQLNNISKNVNNDSIWNALHGSALFYRSIQFLSLLWTYAPAYNAVTADQDNGIVLRLTTDPDEVSKRSTVADCYRQIIHDLRNSIDYLPTTAINSLRPTITAAQGLLARTYLSMGNYDSAFYFADQVLQERNELLDFNNASEVDLYGFPSFKRFNKETIFYAELTNAQASLNQFFAFVDTTLYSSYDNNDLRKSAYYYSFGPNRNIFKGSYGQASVLFGGLATDEMYLIRAESSAQSGDIDRAIQDLNTLLRSRWVSSQYTDLIAADQHDVLQLIKTERRKELVLRGLRWSDIKRFNRNGDNVSIKRVINGETIELPSNDPRFTLPLPDDIIKQTGMPQNPR